MKKIIYYNTFEDDVVQSNNQKYKLKKNYKWVKNSIFYRACSMVLYIIFYIIRNYIFEDYFTCEDRK